MLKASIWWSGSVQKSRTDRPNIVFSRTAHSIKSSKKTCPCWSLYRITRHLNVELLTRKPDTSRHCFINLPHSYSICDRLKKQFPTVRVTCLSVCAHSHGRLSWSTFTKTCTDVITLKVRTSSLGSIPHHPFPYFIPKNPHYLILAILVYIFLECFRIAEVLASYRKLGVEEHDGDVRF